MATLQLCISATFTAEPLQPVLAFWGSVLGVHLEIRYASYNQVFQSLLDPAGDFARNPRGLNILLIRIEDLGEDEALATANSRYLLEQVRSSIAHFPAPLLVCLCPPSSPAKRYAVAEDLFSHSLTGVAGVQFLHYREVLHSYPVERVENPEGERLGRIPFTDAFFAALATSLIRHAHALFRPPYKVIAVDCDNTLWSGICGEDGPEGVELDPPRRYLQEFLAEQREAGMLLAMVSKNNEQDVLDTFAAHPEMPLQLRHFVSWRINWEPKAANLASLANELNLGLDSFLFLDDNPKECAEVAESLPEVVSLPLPEPIEGAPHYLEHVWAFDHPVITEEDRQRNTFYAQSLEFGREVKRSSHDLAGFLATLALEVRIEPLQAARLARAAQLTQRTNQFNCTTIRRTEQALLALLAEDPGTRLVTLDVSDRFGQYGVTGLLIYAMRGEACVVDTFLLSCRVLGRGVEHRVLRWLGEQAAMAGAQRVELPLLPTRRNQPAREFLDAVAGAYRMPREEGFVYRIPVETTREVERLAASQAEAGAALVLPARPADRVKLAQFVEFDRIARELASVAQVLGEIRRHEVPTDPALSEIERQLTPIWCELLQVPPVSVNDNFFDLGGHSLLVVLLLVRIRETFDVELSVDAVYSGTLTIAELARQIEAAQIAGLNAEEYASLLAEIDGLSDEEVRALLEQEGQQPAEGQTL